MRKMLLGLALIALCGTVTAARAAGNLADVLRSDHPDTYTVRSGDTLWDISGRFLSQPWMWPELWRANAGIENPHLIYPGDVIRFAYVDGQPALLLERGGRTAAPSSAGRLSPSIRAEPLLGAIPAIRMEAIRSFLVDNRIVDRDELDAAPYVLQGADERIVLGAGDRLYARGKLVRGESYSIVRRGNRYIDPDTGEMLGIEAVDVGGGRIEARRDDIATMAVSRAREEVRIQDRLLPTEERAVETSFFPSSPDGEIEGRILSVFGGVTQIGTYDVVVVNRGEREGLAAGNVFAILRQGDLVRDRIAKEQIRLPSERAGLLMIFRTFEKLAYGLVLQAERPLAVGDEIGNP